MKKRLIFIIPCVAVLFIFGVIIWNHTEDSDRIKDGAFTYRLTDGGDAYSVGLNRSYKSRGAELVIPSSFRDKPVTEIEDSGFASCTDIKRIEIPASVKKIGNEAFRGCTALESVLFSEGAVLDSIGNAAFYECEGLRQIELPSGIKYISYNLFYGCGSLRHAAIPEGITQIYDGAFGFCIALEDMRIPSTVQSIGDKAFKSCYALRSVEFGTEGGASALTCIGRGAFYGCRSMTELELPAALETVGGLAFAYCEGLELISFTGAALETVGGSAFLGCSELRGVDIADIASWCSVNFLKNDYSNPIYIAQRFSVGGVPVIRLEIPEGVSKIGARAFKNATSVVSVVLPSSLEGSEGAIGTDAFRYCYKLVEIYNYSELQISQNDKAATGYISTFAKAVYSLGGESYPKEGEQFPYGDAGRVYSEDEYTAYRTNIYSVGEFLFYKNGSERVLLGYFGDGRDIALPKTEYGYSVLSAAFFGQRGIGSVAVPDSVSAILQYAFYGCSDLERIYISDGVQTVESNIFGKTSGVGVYVEAGGAPDGWSKSWSSGARDMKIFYSQKKEDLPWVGELLGE